MLPIVRVVEKHYFAIEIQHRGDYPYVSTVGEYASQEEAEKRLKQIVDLELGVQAQA